MFGWRGKILRVNLTEGKMREETLEPKVAREYIGGRGLGVYYLNRECDPKCESDIVDWQSTVGASVRRKSGAEGSRTLDL